MKRLPSPALCVALAALVVAATPVADAASIVKRSLFAQNSAMVGGVKVSKTPKAGRLLPLGRNGKFPASVVPAGKPGAAGATGATGSTGATGPTGPTGPAGTDASLSGVAAGGALAGTYPNPVLAPGSVVPAAFGAIPQVLARRSTGLAILNLTTTYIPLPSEDFDTANMHDTSVEPECVRPPIAGVYSITASVRWKANAAGTRIIAINADGILPTSSYVVAVTGGRPTDQNIATLMKLPAGVCVKLLTYQDSGSSVDLEQNGIAAPNLTMTWAGKG
jgi:hypothetical protein